MIIRVFCILLQDKIKHLEEKLKEEEHHRKLFQDKASEVEHHITYHNEPHVLLYLFSIT